MSPTKKKATEEQGNEEEKAKLVSKNSAESDVWTNPTNPWMYPSKKPELKNQEKNE